MFNNKQKEKISLQKLVKIYYWILFVISFIFIAQFIVLGSIFLANRDEDVRLALFITSLVLLIAIVAYVVFVIVRYTKIIYGGLYKNTVDNYSAIESQSRSLEKYENAHNYVEFSELNRIIERINKLYEVSIINNGKLDYKRIGLVSVHGYQNAVTYESFVEHYKEVLNSASSYRNALISFQYPRNIKSLNKEEFALFVKTVKKIFNFDELLIINNEKINEYLLFIPRFDSMDYLKACLQKGVESLCINRSTSTGYDLINCKASLVIYPYSHYNDLLEDLSYAKHQGKTINIYLPDKPDKSKLMLMSDARNTSIISRTIEKLASFKNENYTYQELTEKITSLFKSICLYFDFDMAGIVTYNEFEEKYINIISFGDNNIENAVIENEFFSALSEHIDDDGTFYFSSRKNVNQEIGRFLDKYGIESGHYYVINETNNVKGFIYFTKNSPSLFDTYVRESLLIFSFYIANYLYRIKVLKNEAERNSQFNDILKITGCALYSINTRDYSVTSFSPELKKLVPDLKIGDKCYEVLLGKNRKCDKCPLGSGKKVITTIKNNKYESSLALSVVGGLETHILLTPVKNENLVVRERFDHDLLINSYFSFVEAVNNAFMIKERGYMLVMNIDNINAIIGEAESEPLNAFLRNFFNSIKAETNEQFEIYMISNKQFAIVLPYSDNNTVIDLAETVYELSQKNYLGKASEPLYMNLSYYVFPYPFGYTNFQDYNRLINTTISNKIELRYKEKIYVVETKYARSASHQRYILDVLNTSITSNTFKVKLQPTVDQTRKIINAELLFRIADANRGGELNTLEVINAAASEKKISLITNLLLDYIDHLYSTYEKSVFKRYNINKVSINVDYSFFEDSAFYDRYTALKNKYKLSDSFIQLEIAEKELEKHYDAIQSVLSKVKSINGALICDNYTGEFLSPAQLKNLGFSGVKVNYRITSRIDVSEDTLDDMKNISASCETVGLTVGVVGVESIKQFALLKEINPNITMQGYYFYRPLEEQEFVSALTKSTNN